MRTDEFEFHLPDDLIAQHPTPRRDQSRLLTVDRRSGTWSHRRFPDLPLLFRPGDLLVLNNTRVLSARLRGIKDDTGGGVEMLLLEELGPLDWWSLVRPGKRLRPGTRVRVIPVRPDSPAVTAEVVAKNEAGWCRLRFSGVSEIRSVLGQLGQIPLPPYIQRPLGESDAVDEERYQTVFAQTEGSIAAPTAGLHFTPEILERLRADGVEIAPVTLHVGYGTFAPVKVENVEGHTLHEELYDLPEATVTAVDRTRARGGRVVAVGTTSVRVLESVAQAHSGRLVAGPGRTRIFLHPPHRFAVVDALLTNFHLPQSTLLMLVSAFAAPGEHPRGRDLVLAAYADAVRERYRFFSYGDAMFLH